MASPSLAILRVQSDERLAALARAGHERAFEAIVERYRRPLLRHARRLVGDARAEDVVQQALVSAWTALERGDDVRELGAWLHRIVRNTGLNALRAQRESTELKDSLAGGAAPQEVLERRLTVRETLEALAALPERQREALLRTAVEGRSQAEVAESLGLTDGAVRQLVHRARIAMRAAATALTPLPAASWLASLGTRSEPIAGRVGELVAGAGAGATLAKAGAIAILAGGAATGPALVERYEDRARSGAAKSERAERPAAPARDGAASLPVAAPVAGGGSGGPGSSGSGRSGSGSSGSGSSGSGSSGSGSSGSGSSGSGSSGSGSSGSGSSGSGSSGSGSSGSGSSGSGSSGSGSSGSGSSGSGTSGSGSSDSGSSGSGTSGSGSSDSGSSGSGTSGSGSTESGSSGSGTSGTGSSGIASSDSGTSGSDTSGSDTSGSGSSGSSGSGSSGSGSGTAITASPTVSPDDSSGSGSG
jgi:RNA polymerase sigma factor (sigma-70 family)